MEDDITSRLYKEQIDILKQEIKDRDEKNSALIHKVQQLENLVDKADVANRDLHTALEHMRSENLRPKNEITTTSNTNDELALDTVRRQYVDLAYESVSWISDKDRMSQRIKFLERECERFTRDNTTLGKQVRHLLRTLEEERGMIIRRQANPSPLATASDVIDRHLVTFESIEELQQQNQKLLSYVKEMTSREEEQEIQLENDEIKRLNSSIEDLKSQLERVKDDRERVLAAFNTIIKERDLFKILLSKNRDVEFLTPEIFQRMVSVACASGPAIANQVTENPDKEAHINDLKSMITRLEKELDDTREELSEFKRRSEEQMVAKSQLLDEAKIKIIEETKRADVFSERADLLEKNIKLITTEFDEMRTKNQRLAFELEACKKLEQELQTLQQEKQQTEQKLQIWQLEKQKLLQEKESKEQELQIWQLEKQNLLQEKDSVEQELQMWQQEKQQLLQGKQQVEQRLQTWQQEKQRLLQEKESLEQELQIWQQEKQKILQEKQLVEHDNQEIRLEVLAFQELRNRERELRLELAREHMRLLQEPRENPRSRDPPRLREPTKARDPPIETHAIHPSDPTDPIDSRDLMDPMNPMDPMDPMDPIDPMDPMDPMDPVDPMDPMDSMDQPVQEPPKKLITLKRRNLD